MNKEIFYQKAYREEDSNLCKYGCYFLTLCFVSQFLNISPVVFLLTKKSVLDFKALAISKGWLTSDCTVQNAGAILNYLTGSKWELITDSKFGLLGQSHFLPINYPTDNGVIEVACYRAKESVNNTHFSILGHQGEVVFNTLGEYWETDQKGRFFKLDKRAFKKVG